MKYYFEIQIKLCNNITFEPLENITDMSIKGDTNSKDVLLQESILFIKQVMVIHKALIKLIVLMVENIYYLLNLVEMLKIL